MFSSVVGDYVLHVHEDVTDGLRGFDDLVEWGVGTARGDTWSPVDKTRCATAVVRRLGSNSFDGVICDGDRRLIRIETC